MAAVAFDHGGSDDSAPRPSTGSSVSTDDTSSRRSRWFRESQEAAPAEDIPSPPWARSDNQPMSNNPLHITEFVPQFKESELPPLRPKLEKQVETSKSGPQSWANVAQVDVRDGWAVLVNGTHGTPLAGIGWKDKEQREGIPGLIPIFVLRNGRQRLCHVVHPTAVLLHHANFGHDPCNCNPYSGLLHCTTRSSFLMQCRWGQHAACTT